MDRGYNNDSDGGPRYPGPNSWQAEKVYAGTNPADQGSGGARNEPGEDCRVDRRDGRLAAGHLLEVGYQSSATEVGNRSRIVAARGTAACPWDRGGRSR